MKTLSIVFAIALTGSLVAPAHAVMPSRDTRQQAVSYADLDLSRDADAETLHRRIRAAARSICWTPGVMEILKISRMRDCADLATAKAVADVNAPALTRYHAARGNTPVYGSALVGNARE